MGNRAVITTIENFKSNGLGLYLHWEGDRKNVKAFLTYAKIFKNYFNNKSYMAETYNTYKDLFVRIYNDKYSELFCILSFIISYSGTRVRFGDVKNLDCRNWDNGTYIIDEKYKIIDREFFYEDEDKKYDIKEILFNINHSMPLRQQIPDDIIENYFNEILLF